MRFFKGMKMPKNWIVARSKKMRGRKRPPRSAEWSRKISLGHIGLKHSEETKRKIGEAVRGREVSFETRERLARAATGVVFSDERRRNIGKALRGEKGAQWKGVGKRVYPYEFDDVLREKIKERDGYACRSCGGADRLHVHHVDFDKQNSALNNLVTLCKSCHSSLHRKAKKK